MKIKKYCLFACAIGLFGSAAAQAPGSESVYGGSASTKSVLSGGTSTDVSESVYIGPGTHQIEGTWDIYARYVVVDPSAVLAGDGVIRFYNPSGAGGTAAATLLDANNLSTVIDVAVDLRNASGMQLLNRAFPTSLTAAGWTDSSATATVYLGRNVDLSVDGADISLGASVLADLKLDNTAVINAYGPQRMVITQNSVLSHLVKENYTTDFVFPIGIADGDYTPVQVSNAANNTIHVAVQDYTASTPDEATADPGPGGIPADGMSRTWHIYADNSGISSDLTLQHNSSTNQSGFADANQFVTQWSSSVPNTSGDVTVPFTSSAWQSNTPGAGSVGTLQSGGAALSGTSMRSRTYASLAVSAVAPESYFTKSSDPLHPLPLHILSFTAQAAECEVALRWTVAESVPAAQYALQHSIDGKTFETIKLFALDTQTSSYIYTHAHPSSGMHHYRVQALLGDKEAMYTPIRTVNVDCAASERLARVYPNPSSDRIIVDQLDPQRVQTIRILSADGKLMSERPVLAGKEVFELSTWPQGSYLLQLLEGNLMKMNVRFEKL